MRGELVLINYAALPDTVITTDVPQVGDFQPAFLGLPVPDATWKAPEGETQAVITFDIAKYQQIDFIGVFDHNLSVDARIKYAFYAGDELLLEADVGAHTAIYNFGEKPFGLTRAFGFPNGDITDSLWFHTVAFVAKQVANKVVVTITDEANPDNQIRVGYIMVGDKFSSKHSFSYGTIPTLIINANEQLQAGKIQANYDQPREAVSLVMERMSEEEAHSLKRGIRFAVQTHTPVFVSLFEGSTEALKKQHQILFYITQDIDFVLTHSNKFNANIKGIEA